MEESQETVLPEEDAQPGRRIPATERVLDYILEELDGGHLAPGARVNAARIAAHLELSAAPVREALCVLAGRGIVDLLPDRGAVMRPIAPREVIHIWGVLSPIVCVGLELGSAAIRQGAEQAEVVAAYAQLRSRAQLGQGVQFLLALNEWHFAVNRLGGNEYVTLALERLGIAYWDRYLADLIDVPANIDTYLENYRRMHESVLAGDGPAAAAILRHHAEWSIALIRRAGDETRRTRRTRRARDNSNLR